MYRKVKLISVLVILILLAQVIIPVVTKWSVTTVYGSVGDTWNYSYTGDVQTFTVPQTGQYYLQVWGAQGGKGSNSPSEGGLGGYTYGSYNLKKGDTIYIYVGGAGATSSTSTSIKGGFNGGGDAYYGAGSGGGATDIRLKRATGASKWNNGTESIAIDELKTDTSLLSRIIVAGGGPGAGSNGTQGVGSGGGLFGATDGTYGGVPIIVGEQESGYAFGRGQDSNKTENNGYGGAGRRWMVWPEVAIHMAIAQGVEAQDTMP